MPAAELARKFHIGPVRHDAEVVTLLHCWDDLGDEEAGVAEHRVCLVRRLGELPSQFASEPKNCRSTEINAGAFV